MTIDAPEIEEVTSNKVKCDGGGDHPRVWLVIPDDTGFIECGYCDKRFVLKDGAGEGH